MRQVRQKIAFLDALADEGQAAVGRFDAARMTGLHARKAVGISDDSSGELGCARALLSSAMTVRTASRCCVALGTNRVPSAMRCGASVAIVAGTDGKGAVSASARSNGSDKASSNGTTNAARSCLTFWSATLSAWAFGTSSLAVRRRAARALISRVSNTPTMNAPAPRYTLLSN